MKKIFLLFPVLAVITYSNAQPTATPETEMASAPEAARQSAAPSYSEGIIDLSLFSESVALKWAAASKGRMAAYRLLRTVEPDLGWENVAEISEPDAEGNFTARDENPLPGKVYYKLQTKNRSGEWTTLDVQMVNRNLGTRAEEIDFFANNRGELIISRNQMPDDIYMVSVFDLQGEQIEAPVTPFGNFIKIDVSSLSFGVYKLLIAGEEVTVSRYFLACGLE